MITRRWKDKEVKVLTIRNGIALILDQGKAEEVPESELGTAVAGKCEICQINQMKYRDLSILAVKNRLPWKSVCEGCSHIFCIGYKAPLEMTDREKLWEAYLEGRDILFEDVV